MRPIDAEALENDVRKRICNNCDKHNGNWCRACWVDDMLGEIDDAPTIEVVPKELYEQILWERNIAMEQLEEHGIGFASKKE